MGTRADFYVGKGPEAEWLGSVAWDGYEWQEENYFKCRTPEGFKEAVKQISLERDDFTFPEMGWPWPWNDSCTTDYAYVWDFDTNSVEIYVFGRPYVSNEIEESEEYVEPPKVTFFPDMTTRKKVALDRRSGLMFITGAS
jgi:hypothetical protein